MSPVYMFGLILLIVVVFVWAWRAHQARLAAFRALAARHGLEYVEKVSGGVPEPALTGFQVFQQGKNRRSANLLQGTWRGHPMRFFEFVYTTGTHKNRHNHRLTVVAFANEETSLPRFSLHPEHLLHKIGDVFGLHETDLPALVARRGGALAGALAGTGHTQARPGPALPGRGRYPVRTLPPRLMTRD